MNFIQENKEVTRMFDQLTEGDVNNLMAADEEYVIFQKDCCDLIWAQPTDYDAAEEAAIFNEGGFYLDKDAFLGLFKRSNSENEFLMELI